MPKRRALTQGQLDELFALPTADPTLIRHWTLDGTDLAAVDRRRGDANQLGYALQLSAFRYPGRLLNRVTPFPNRRCSSWSSNSTSARMRFRPTPLVPRPGASSSTACARRPASGCSGQAPDANFWPGCSRSRSPPSSREEQPPDHLS